MKDIKNTNENELVKNLAEKRLALRNFRFGTAGSKMKNVKESWHMRKDIARILTEINARKRAEVK
jgi:ribosomal protein L29